MSIAMTTGLFSGLDIDQIITQLMSLEKKPLVKLENKKAAYDVKISSFGSLSSSLSKLRDSLAALKAGSIYSLTASSSDESAFKATASASASEGSYNIKVNRLASGQSLYSAAFAAETDPVADLSAYATQKIRLQVGGGAYTDITVDSSNNTLAGIRDAINASGAEVRASVVKTDDATGYRLLLSSKATGASQRIAVMVDEDGDGTFEEAAGETDAAGLSALAFNPEGYDAQGAVVVGAGVANLTQSQAALNAELEVDGLTIQRGSNEITDIITGVTLSLKGVSADAKALTVTRDLSKITANVQTFVESYNAAMGLVRSLVVPVKDEGMVLSGDSTARGIMTSLRSVVTTSFAGFAPADFGLSHDRSGLLALDSSRLAQAAEGGLEGLLDTFDAMAEHLEDTLDGYVRTLIPAKTDGLKRSIKIIEQRIESTELRLEKVESTYRSRFMAMEEMLSELQKSSDFLTAQLSSISELASYSTRRR
ncbi:MAG: flagellar filament capping protein FliD [Thermodesulfovibrionales bacterium]